MPTATEFLGTIAHNLGALTTTFTAPSSCATSINDNSIVFANATSPYPIEGYARCDPVTFADCFPSGDGLDSFINENPPAVFQITSFYFSPGVACPAGWKTVGALAHAENGKMSASGVLAEEPPDPDAVFPQNLWVTDAWRNMLDTSETLAYCCPSDYVGDISGACVSTLGPVSSYSYSQQCAVWFTDREIFTPVSSVPGLSYSNGVWSYMSQTGTEGGITSMIGLGKYVGATSNDFADIAVATRVQAVPLIYKKSDMDKKERDGETGTTSATETASTTDASTATDSSPATDAETAENAASTISRQGTVSILALTSGLLAGMAMLLC